MQGAEVQRVDDDAFQILLKTIQLLMAQLMIIAVECNRYSKTTHVQKVSHFFSISGYCLSLFSLTHASFQLHRADSDGDGPVQAAEESEAKQRPRLLLPLPDPARPQVHSLRQRVAPGPQALQPAHQHHL